MTRYVIIALIAILAGPAFVNAAATPSSSLERHEHIRELQRELEELLVIYNRLLAQRAQRTAVAGVSIAKSTKPASAPTRTPTRTPTTYSSPVVLDTSAQLESLVLQFTNDARRQNGRAPLANDGKLVALARAHSADMLKNDYFSHKDLSGCNSTCRMNKSGYAWQKMGENIHQMSGYDLSLTETAQKIVNDWMNSPSHRDNLLDPVFTHAGIGVAMQGSNIYTTTEYSLPR